MKKVWMAAAAAGAACLMALPAMASDTVEIHYAYWQEALGDYLESAKANFEAANPGVSIVLEPTSWDEYWTKLETAASGGSAADAFQLNGPNINKYATAGILAPLDDYIASSDIELNNYPQAMVSLYNVDGVQYGIPIDYDTIGLWYNKELFDAAGVDYPTADWTWDDLTAAAEKLTDADNGVYGISAGYADQAGFYNTVPAYGGYIISEDGKTSGFDQEGTIAGIKCWTDLMDAGYSPSQASIDENPDYTQFMSGKIAMLFAGDWFAGTFAGEDSQIADVCDVQYLPLVGDSTDHISVIHGKGNCVNANSEHVDEAWAWVAYLGGAEANELLGNSGAAIPAYTEYSGLFFEQYPQYNMSIFSDEAETAATYPHGPGAAEWGDVIWNELVPVYSGEADLETACANITTQMNDILAAQ